MKVFSKLKGIFFDEVEDEDETPELEEKIQIKEVAHEEKKEEFKPFDLDEVKEEKEEKLENPVNDFSERELFRSEKPFTFTEFNLYRDKCNFRDCIHIHENKCEVKAKVEDGTILKSRYENYIKFVK